MVRGKLLAGGARAGRGAAAAQAARARRTQLEARHGGGERTSNMLLMSVTLDVLKYTGWLNFSAFCQAERRACDAGRGAGWKAGELGRGAAAAQAARRRARLGRLRQGMGGAHVEHAVHARDAGRVEVHPPVERPRALPSRKEGMRCVGAKTVGLIREARCRNGW